MHPSFKWVLSLLPVSVQPDSRIAVSKNMSSWKPCDNQHLNREERCTLCLHWKRGLWFNPYLHGSQQRGSMLALLTHHPICSSRSAHTCWHQPPKHSRDWAGETPGNRRMMEEKALERGFLSLLHRDGLRIDLSGQLAWLLLIQALYTA